MTDKEKCELMLKELIKLYEKEGWHSTGEVLRKVLGEENVKAMEKELWGA